MCVVIGFNVIFSMPGKVLCSRSDDHQAEWPSGLRGAWKNLCVHVQSRLHPVPTGDPDGHNSKKLTGLKGDGLKICERVPITVALTTATINYLKARQEKMGHLLSVV